MKKNLKYFKILFINIIVFVYLVELILFLFLPDIQKTLVEIKETRLSIAKDLGLKYDLRSPEQAFLDTKQNNINLSPKFYFNRTFANARTFKKALLNNEPIPFRGPINKQTLSCAEDLNYRVINNDKFGFKNPNIIYKKKIEIALLGDSYAEGVCYDEKNDITANLRAEKYNSANFGVSGSGPLVTLGIFKEYVKSFKPDYVIYIYTEQNDISDLEWEKSNYILKNYLKKNYTQNLLGQEEKIKKFLSDISNESYEYIVAKNNITKLSKPKKTIVKIELLKDFLELTNTKNYIRNIFYSRNDNGFDKKLFFSIINIIKNETNAWGGKFIFVYTPSWSRYFTEFTKEERYFSRKNLILSRLEKNNILTIDLTKFFDQENDLTQYFPLGYLGHFSEKGYKEISKVLINKIKNEDE